MDKQVFTMNWAGRPLTVEVGQLAKQASASALIRYGDTVVLSAVVGEKEPKEGQDFFPLQVLYEEKMYAVGKIPGGYIKREGRPSEHATLTARLIDRPIRPMFPEGFKNDVQVINTVLSVDPDCTPEMAAMLGSSIALTISDIPFYGPIAGVNVGRVNGDLVINPTIEQQENSDLELTVAGSGNAINMVESSAAELSEAEMLEALMFGFTAIKELCYFQEEIKEAVGQEKMDVPLDTVDAELEAEATAQFYTKMADAIKVYDKLEREEAIEQVKEEIIAHFDEKYVDDEDFIAIHNQAVAIADQMEYKEVRRLITEDKVRPDGREIDEIRPLDSEVGLLPRAHGSGLFTRGQTQVLSALTLAPISEEQRLDGLNEEDSRRFMHHYNFPQYCVGSTGRYGSPGRREIGHGALGHRALDRVMPSEEEFPYAIRLVAEVLESNGSSSQASICAGTLALMDGGVPIKAPVAGIAMGLIMDENEENYTILTDIQGLEDHLGDMDFKVAGTRAGITALQMDIKIQGITEEILKEALEQAQTARMQILDHMSETIAETRPELSQYAPKIEQIQIKPDQIKVVIGKGGDTINKIIDETGVKIDIDEDGRVNIASSDADAIARAKEIIEELTLEVEPGQVYEGTVKRIEKFGAFVNIAKGKDGLVHISELQHKRTNRVEDVVSIGDTVKVKVLEIDNRGRINLSMKALTESDED
ncbi:polyribonucleotide nucleotidyltransferase [Aerococcus suis]|uniref:Polyribonucleotide nucleotidyltransferase n=1 Tax=Aerococcus suis TaxID=371602 RepID=A0A1W1Y342_9LACT|nr:polyribonucleotide nucleotidyltransferase [Aerococcus suis]MCI7240461.1 polyribonucleotide nucleotidyltransferase [Aerococcus suis]MDD7758902.1 polyribonucleotide nucleotidyltransferase [Aerococcus suis]MDY4646241.1 polyribonucleotide nucleotidyltransferase [Aerococcus suis]SMC30555.1 polyribonucleotide nucleotidyltransferase [Aerococcus suis]